MSKTKILVQHLRLDILLGEAREALLADDAASAREAFARLRADLETHFEQEDRLYYPSIGALRPAQKAALQACTVAHATFRSTLRDIGELLEGEAMESARQALDLLAQAFERHEATEEAVLEQLDRERANAAVAEPSGSRS